MRRLFGCPDIVSLTEKFLMARNFYRIFTENNPVMGDSKTFGIPEAKGLTTFLQTYILMEVFFTKEKWPCPYKNKIPGPTGAICIHVLKLSWNYQFGPHLPWGV